MLQEWSKSAIAVERTRAVFLWAALEFAKGDTQVFAQLKVVYCTLRAGKWELSRCRCGFTQCAMHRRAKRLHRSRPIAPHQGVVVIVAALGNGEKWALPLSPELSRMCPVMCPLTGQCRPVARRDRQNLWKPSCLPPRLPALPTDGGIGDVGSTWDEGAMVWTSRRTPIARV